MATDALGRIVPGRLEDTFSGRERLAEWANNVDEACGRLAYLAHDPCCDGIDVPEVLRLMQRARLLVLQGMPYGECDCGAFAHCEKCGDKRWLTAKEFLATSKPVYEFRPLGFFKSNGQRKYRLSRKRLSAEPSSNTKTWTSLLSPEEPSP